MREEMSIDVVLFHFTSSVSQCFTTFLEWLPVFLPD